MIKDLDKTYLNELVELIREAYEPLKDIYGEYSGKGVKELFSKFKNLKLDLDNVGRKMGQWFVQASK